MGSHTTKMLPLLRTSIETVKTRFTFLFQAIQGHMENADCKAPWYLGSGDYVEQNGFIVPNTLQDLSPILVCYPAALLWRHPTQTEFPTPISVNSCSGTAWKLSGREENTHTHTKKIFFQQNHYISVCTLCDHMWGQIHGDTHQHLLLATFAIYSVREPLTDHLWKSGLIIFFLSFKFLVCAAVSGREHHAFTVQQRIQGSLDQGTGSSLQSLLISLKKNLFQWWEAAATVSLLSPLFTKDLTVIFPLTFKLLLKSIFHLHLGFPDPSLHCFHGIPWDRVHKASCHVQVWGTFMQQDNHGICFSLDISLSQQLLPSHFQFCPCWAAKRRFHSDLQSLTTHQILSVTGPW